MAGAFDFSPMQNSTSVNFFQKDPETATDVNALLRQRQMAQLLTQRGLQGQEGQMVSGHYVAPSALSYVNQLGSALLGAQQTRSADAKEAQLAQALLAKRTKDSSDFMSALNGTPASSREVDGPPVEGGSAPMQTTPAVPGDTNKAIAIALQSQNPQLSGMAPELLKRQMDASEFNAALQAAQGGPGASAGGAPTGGGGGNTMGLNAQAYPFLSSPNSRAQAFGKAIQEANKPMAIAEGGTAYVPGQGAVFTAPKTEAGISVQNGQAGPVPGFAEAQARREGLVAGAKESATTPYKTQTVDTPAGPRLMTTQQVLQTANGGGGPVNGQPIANPMAPRPGDTDRAQVYQQERESIAKQLQAAQQSGDTAQVARLQQDALGLEKEIKSNKIPLAPMPVPGIALQSDEQKKFGQQVATQSADALLASRDKAKTASDDLLSVSQARKAIQQGAYQGSGADTKLAIAKFVNANIPGVSIDAEKVGNTDYLKSTLGAGVLAQAKSLGANPSNADAERINDIVGSIGKDPQAMSKLLDWREAMSRRAIENHNKTVGDAEGRGMSSPYDLRVNPQSAAPAAGGGFKIIGVQ